uniref:RHS repeat domain-containing protein n=1 Tax=Phocaeicola salanitronis TaxID=376805 RepID=UPI0023F82CAE
ELQNNAVSHDRKRMEKERGIRCRATGTGWLYEWASNGMLKKVVRPDGRPVDFRYDALGRRTAKQYFGKVTRWVWDGNVPLHEWCYKAIGIQSDEEKNTPPKEPADDITTWVFEAGTFVPAAKIQDGKQYSIVSDYLGTPVQMYDGQGNKTWDCTLDIYGKVLVVDKGTEFDCPFRFQGQYEDEETGLYYNRFRYYLPNFGGYISQDPINLKGGIKFYSYVSNPTIWLDILGLFHHNDTGFYVYGLFDIIDIDEKGQFIFADTPYYIGITNNLPVRASQHRASGRLGKNNYMRPLEEKVTYGQARGYEQAYIEYYGTKTGIINEKISAVNRGNKINSFDIDNTTRARDRHQCFTENRENKLNELASKDKHH